MSTIEKTLSEKLQQPQQQHPQLQPVHAQQFLVRWHYHRMTFVDNLTHVLDAGFLTDVTISVENRTVRAHRLVLAMCSLYFCQLFQDLSNVPNPIIILPNVCFDDLRAILAFMYRGHCIISRSQLPSLIATANLLKIKGLCDVRIPHPEADDDTVASESVSMSEQKCDNNNGQWGQPPPTPPTPTFTNTPTFSEFNDNDTRNEPRPPRRDYHTHRNNAVSAPSGSNSQHTDAYKCVLCGKFLSNQYNLRVHMETHEGTFHACSACTHISSSRDALRKHISYRHPDQCIPRKRKKAPP